MTLDIVDEPLHPHAKRLTDAIWKAVVVEATTIKAETGGVAVDSRFLMEALLNCGAACVRADYPDALVAGFARASRFFNEEAALAIRYGAAADAPLDAALDRIGADAVAFLCGRAVTEEAKVADLIRLIETLRAAALAVAIPDATH